MPHSSRLVAECIAQFFVTHVRPWARAVAIRLSQEVVGLVHQLAVARAARYVPPYLFFAVLMLLRVKLESKEVAQRLCAEFGAGDMPRMKDAFVCVAWNLGEAFLLGLAIRHLERAVRFLFLLFLMFNSCACHVARYTVTA